MKRKIIEAAAAYLSGLFFASFFNWNIFFFISAAAVIALIMHIKGAVVRDFAIIILSFAVGIGYFRIYTNLGYDKIIKFNETNGYFSGEVTQIKTYDGDNASYVLKGKINNDVSAEIYVFMSNTGAEYGDIIDMDCEFSAFENSYIFNSEDYYKSENIYLHADSPHNIKVYPQNSRKIKNFLAEYRENMTEKFKIILGEDCGSFMAGMIFGEKQSLNDNIKTALYRSGIGHILSVSGLHVSVIAAFIMFLLRKMRINRFLSFGIINIFMILLVIMANSPVSAVRAMIMLDFIYSAQLFYRQNDTFNSLAWASILICTLNPYSVYSSGFVLSFAGTFGIGVFAPYMTKNIRKDTVLQKLKYNILTALCASVFIFPFSMYYFDETSLISPVSNIILVPLCTASMITGVAYMLTGGIIPFIYSAYIFISPVIYLSEKSAEISFLQISKGSQYSAYILFGLCAVCTAIHMIFGKRKFLGTAVIMSFAVFSVFCTSYSVWRYNNFIVSVIGQGRNVSVVINYKGDTNIIDISGNYHSPQYIRKYLGVNSISSVNNLVITKNMNSLYSSYISELKYYKINNLSFSDDFSMKNSFSCEYKDGILVINFNNSKIILSPAKENNHYDGLNVFYGNLPPDINSNIYLGEYDNGEFSDMNNFEIIVYNDGVYRIRRL